MLAAKTTRKPPKAPRTVQALWTDPPVLRGCPGCHGTVWEGHVDGVRTRCEVSQLTDPQAVAAVLLGIRIYLWSATGMIWLDADRAALRAKYPVICAHRCGQQLGVAWPPPPRRDDSDLPPY